MEIVRSGDLVIVKVSHEDLSAAATSETLVVEGVIPRNHIVQGLFAEIEEAFDGDIPQLSVTSFSSEYVYLNTVSVSSLVKVFAPVLSDDGGAFSQLIMGSEEFSRSESMDLNFNFSLNSGTIAAITTGELVISFKLIEF